MERTKIALIDSDFRRRASISHALTNMAMYVIPLEHYSELTQCWPRKAVLLIEDAGSAVESLCRMFHLHNKSLPFVAFSADASPMRRSATLLKGAGAYLPWPCGIEELKSTLLSVLANHDVEPEHALATGGERSGFPQLAANNGNAARDKGLRHASSLWRASPDLVRKRPLTYAE